MNNVIFNTIHGEELYNRISLVLNGVAERIGKTLGPYGHNVLIPMTESTLSTKDGWNYLQQINLKDPVDRIIKKMIEKCGQSVILKVGDGSTSVTVASNELNDMIIENKIVDRYTIREIEDGLTYCVNTIISVIQEHATTITDENMADAIKKIALVSTNWNEELAGIITDIYVNTKNPIIKLVDSGTEQTSYTIVDGYDINGHLMLDNYYMNNRLDGKCELKNPLILVLNYTIQLKLAAPLITLGELAASMGRHLVILAPAFEHTFLDTIATQNRLRSKNNKPFVNLVPVTFVNAFNIDKDCVDDFCVMTSSMMVSKTDDDFDTFINDTYDALVNVCSDVTDDIDDETKKLANQEKQKRLSTIEASKAYLEQICGSCDIITITDKNITASGLSHIDTKMVSDRKEQIKSELDKKIKECDALTMLTDDIRMKRIRLGKLQGKMGVIQVGGYGDANLKAKKDALDDAIRACEAAYRNGYIFGSGTAVGYAIQRISQLPEKYPDAPEISKELYNCIYGAFFRLFKTLVKNKYSGQKYKEILEKNYCPSYIRGLAESSDDAHELRVVNIGDIFNTCTDLGRAYNIITDDIDKDGIVINPIDVDIEVLRGCLRLVTMCITSDQMTIPNYAFNGNDEKYSIVEGN